jgi:hypothetical protein
MAVVKGDKSKAVVAKPSAAAAAKAAAAAAVARSLPASGLRWVNVGSTRPAGVELTNPALQLALLRKTSEYAVEGAKGGRKEVRHRMHDLLDIEFTDVEWKALKVSDLRIVHIVRADPTRWMITAERAAEDRSQLMLSRELFHACRNGDTRQTALLIERKANVDFPDKYRCTALLFAATGGHAAVCGLLLGAGVNVNARSVQGDTPLGKAAIRGHVDVCHKLLDAGADRESRDLCGETCAA